MDNARAAATVEGPASRTGPFNAMRWSGSFSSFDPTAHLRGSRGTPRRASPSVFLAVVTGHLGSARWPVLGADHGGRMFRPHPAAATAAVPLLVQVACAVGRNGIGGSVGHLAGLLPSSRAGSRTEGDVRIFLQLPADTLRAAPVPSLREKQTEFGWGTRAPPMSDDSCVAT